MRAGSPQESPPGAPTDPDGKRKRDIEEEKGDADIFAAARAEVVLQRALEKRSASPLCYSEETMDKVPDKDLFLAYPFLAALANPPPPEVDAFLYLRELAHREVDLYEESLPAEEPDFMSLYIVALDALETALRDFGSSHQSSFDTYATASIRKALRSHSGIPINPGPETTERLDIAYKKLSGAIRDRLGIDLHVPPVPSRHTRFTEGVLRPLINGILAEACQNMQHGRVKFSRVGEETSVWFERDEGWRFHFTLPAGHFEPIRTFCHREFSAKSSKELFQKYAEELDFGAQSSQGLCFETDFKLYNVLIEDEKPHEFVLRVIE
jgi:hypothetical protein